MSYPQGPQYGGYQQQPQPGGYPQQQGYPPQPGYPPPYPPPQKNNNALVIALAGVAAAAVIALVLVLALSGKDDEGGGTASGTSEEARPPGAPDVTIPGPNAGNRPSGGSRPSSGGGSGGGAGAPSPEALAEAAADVIQSRSTGAIDQLACSSTAASELKREVSRVPAGTTAQVQGVTNSGSTAQARIGMDMNGQTQTITLEMRKNGSKWCASGI
ncbi:hypothetical protein DMH04_47520 [Kibdelosporangium aridum]|uniref:DUF4878 domain-containing protein n=1 Tax=Kibdelosporangium aridum TaxID=2030 RepID=A0A428YKK5_KIBAR|nr:hypothetical protein [Kibdelosporangium aridum]RSM68143.1 hypothetical protein DMH04_47520 [Kibdelosporangium aridum]